MQWGGKARCECKWGTVAEKCVCRCTRFIISALLYVHQGECECMALYLNIWLYILAYINAYRRLVRALNENSFPLIYHLVVFMQSYAQVIYNNVYVDFSHFSHVYYIYIQSYTYICIYTIYIHICIYVQIELRLCL